MSKHPILKSAMCIGVAMLLPGLAHAGPVRAAPGGAIHLDPGRITIGYLNSLSALKTAMERQQTLDGGALTPEHSDKFDARLRRINDLYLRTLHNQNPLTVDANGTPIRDIAPGQDWTHSSLMTVGVSN